MFAKRYYVLWALMAKVYLNIAFPASYAGAFNSKITGKK
jgi:hypothetical protein